MAALTTVVVAAAATAVAGAVAGAGAPAGTGVGAAPTPQQVTAEARALLGRAWRLMTLRAGTVRRWGRASVEARAAASSRRVIGLPFFKYGSWRWELWVFKSLVTRGSKLAWRESEHQEIGSVVCIGAKKGVYRDGGPKDPISARWNGSLSFRRSDPFFCFSFSLYIDST